MLSREMLYTFSALSTDFLVSSWFPLPREFGGISSLRNSVVHCGQASFYTSVQTNEILGTACGLSKLAIRDNVTDTVMNKINSFKGNSWSLQWYDYHL